MKLLLGGWQRLAIILAACWMLVVAGYAVYELKSGPFSPSLVTETVVAKTGAPVAVLNGNDFRDLVPVETRLLPAKVGLVLALPFLVSLLIFGSIRAFKWVVAGFRVGRT